MDWSIEKAKNRFGSLVDQALKGEPQLVTRHGKPAVVVISATAYAEMQRRERADAPSLGELLLAMPQDDEAFAREEIAPRDVDFECS